MNLKVTFIISILIFITACVPKTNIILLDNGKVKNAVIVSTDKGSTKLDKTGSSVGIYSKDKAPSKIRSISEEEIRRKYRTLFKAMPKEPKSYILYFKNNSTELTNNSKTIFKEALKMIVERSPCVVDIIGHTDTVGSEENNIKVSLKRAKHIKSMIIQTEIKYSKPEVQNIDVQTILLVAKGYGEADLLVKTEDNVAEEKNRNVEVFIK